MKMLHKLVLLGILPCVFLVLVLLPLVNKQSTTIVEDDMTVLRETLLEAKKTELRHSLEMVMSLIEPFYAASQNIASPEAREAIEILKRLKYGEDGYIFGYDGDSNRVFSGKDTVQLGASFREYKDVNGVFLINDLVREGQAGGGFVTYHFPRQGQDKTAYPKLSYAVWLQKWNLMIGTGFYIDNIDRTVADARAVSEAHTRDTFIMSFIASGVILVLVFGAALLIARRTVNPINTLAQSLRAIASGGGDLTQRLQRRNDDEVGEVITAFNQFVDSIHSLIKNIYESTEELRRLSEAVAKDTSESFTTLNHQRDQTQQIASAINQMAMSALEIARSTQEAADAANTTEQTSKSAEGTVNDSIRHIHELSDEVQRNTEGLQELQENVHGIGSVLDVIRGVAEQTNLLALNASIEAARAGEQGRGFAVVADEVRGLAARTQDSTREIQQMIERLRASTTAAIDSILRSVEKGDVSVAMVAETSRALKMIDDQVGTITQRNLLIATAAEEQTQVIESINRNMHEIASATEIANESASRSHSSSETLRRIGAELEGLVKQFKL